MPINVLVGTQQGFSFSTSATSVDTRRTNLIERSVEKAFLSPRLVFFRAVKASHLFRLSYRLLHASIVTKRFLAAFSDMKQKTYVLFRTVRTDRILEIYKTEADMVDVNGCVCGKACNHGFITLVSCRA